MAVFCGCEVHTSDGTGGGFNTPQATPPPLLEEMRATDLVKMISPDISFGSDPVTYNQNEYVVNPRRRLLLSYTGIGAHVGVIDTSHGGRVVLEISLQKIGDTEQA